MKDNRIIQNGTSLDFTCENRRFKTDVQRGFAHYPGNNYLGSVTDTPLYDDGGFSLWLEYVVNVNDPNDKCLWFMWYQDGWPTIPMSAVIDESNIVGVIQNIAAIKFGR